MVSLAGYAQTHEGFLLRICEDEFCEIGTPTGYVNSKGDTIIPVGQYFYCYTDTIKGYGIVLDTNGRCMAIDNEGNYLYEVKWFDNGPDYISDGLFRIIRNGKEGYANEKGEIVIEPRYACTTPFENGKAKVTYECELVESGEYKIMKSMPGFSLTKREIKLSKYQNTDSYILNPGKPKIRFPFTII